jgi:MarR family transcriptional regulator for hemolysin
LAELLDFEPITLVRIVDKLETNGLIERQPHPSDRRVWLLHLTPAARPKLTLVRKIGNATRSEALAGLSETDRDGLIKTLKAMKENLADACHEPVREQGHVSHG